MTDLSHPFENILMQYARAIRPELERYLDPNRMQPEGVTPLHDAPIEHFHWQISRDYPERGGKYLRGSLVVLLAEGMGAAREMALKTAAAMELSQNWILIHDDVEDDSLVRRGKPALHRIYGSALAINAGDALHMIMWKILRDNEAVLGAARTFRIIDQFYNMLLRTCMGQTAELYHLRENNYELDENDYFYIIDGKTAYYTVAGPMRLGALVAADDLRRLEHDIFPLLDRFGMNFGRAFQIHDDWLDLATDFKAQRGNDIVEGKRTMMLLHLLQHASASDRDAALTIFRRFAQMRVESPEQLIEHDAGDPTEWRWTQAVTIDIDRVLELMGYYGSLDHSRALVEEYSDEALALVEDMDFITTAARDNLKLGVEFNRSRLK